MKQTVGLAALIAGMGVGCFTQYEPIEPFTPAQLSKVENTALDSRCELPGESSMCRAAITRFYFNKADKTCTEYVWGGCNDVKVPFQTKEECEKACYK